MSRRLARLAASGLVAAAASAALAAPAMAEGVTYVGTEYIYSYNSAGLKACKAYGPKAQKQYHADSYKCSKYVNGNTYYRIYVGTK